MVSAGIRESAGNATDGKRPSAQKTVAVYGMGYVGLTLAYTFAHAGIPVVGIDKSDALLAKLKRNEAPFYEDGLDAMMKSVAANNPMKLGAQAGVHPADIHIISVGTPVGKNKRPDLSFVKDIAASLAQILKPGDIVILRSTVQIGTTRTIVLPILESKGLKGGKDFFLAFAPERTIEGKALQELTTLPQIVGGLDQTSIDLAGALFKRITSGKIVPVASLEAAEMVKLMNNTFRDLVFSFANETALICDAFNIDAFDLIKAANLDYPRDPIRLPSPGVAGSCLTKDPYLYSDPIADIGYSPVLGKASRAINERGPEYVIAKLKKFGAAHGRKFHELKIVLIGLAFKGQPETSDFRDSVALELILQLPERGNVKVKDHVVTADAIRALGFEPVDDVAAAIRGCDAVVVMNNHAKNTSFDLSAALKDAGHPILFFDGWHQFDRKAIESIPGATYATMGYMTKRDG